MTKKQFNREYFVRLRVVDPEVCTRLGLSKKSRNILVSYDRLSRYLGMRFERVLNKVERACACKVVIRPFHGVELTFIAH